MFLSPWRQATSLITFLRWALGFPNSTQGPGSHGFSSEALLPERERSLAERGIALTTTLSVVWVLLDRVTDMPCPASGPALVLGLGALGWGIRMYLPRRQAMDRTALALGAYTLAPWLTAFLFGIPGGVGQIGEVLIGFAVCAAGLLALAVVGLGLDVRREIQEKDRKD